MPIAEFMGFVLAVCNIHSTQVSRLYKEDCAIWWSNCAITQEDKVDRMKLTECLKKAEKAKEQWGAE
jgi:hypothetical protein